MKKKTTVKIIIKYFTCGFTIVNIKISVSLLSMTKLLKYDLMYAYYMYMLIYLLQSAIKLNFQIKFVKKHNHGSVPL